jgi:hypothetical protein
MADEPELYYVNADKTAVVPQNHPDARYLVNENDLGEFEDVVKAHRKGRKAQAADEDKAQGPAMGDAQNKGFEPNPPGSPERERHEASKRGK